MINSQNCAAQLERSSTIIDPRPGHPKSISTPFNIAKIQDLILEDWLTEILIDSGSLIRKIHPYFK